jgi:hypothetical protein
VLIKSRQLSPKFVVFKLLNGYFRETLGKTLSEASISDLNQFFSHFHWHFNDDDIDDFLKLADSVGLSNLPGVVQESLECSYK